MNKNTSIIVVVVILIILLGIWLANRNDYPDTDNDLQNVPAATNSNNNTGTPGTVNTVTTTSTTTVTTGVPVGTKAFTVAATNFKFQPVEMRVKQGDRVRVTLDNQTGRHDFVLDEFNARTAVLDGGQQQTIEFVADKKGTFEYYCSVGTHRQMGMKGNLIVE
ncbi:MAG: cupredoxin domain-containing protein [Patescibacteria group bacterium]